MTLLQFQALSGAVCRAMPARSTAAAQGALLLSLCVGSARQSPSPPFFFKHLGTIETLQTGNKTPTQPQNKSTRQLLTSHFTQAHSDHSRQIRHRHMHTQLRGCACGINADCAGTLTLLSPSCYERLTTLQNHHTASDPRLRLLRR